MKKTKQNKKQVKTWEHQAHLIKLGTDQVNNEFLESRRVTFLFFVLLSEKLSLYQNYQCLVRKKINCFKNK